MRKVKRSLCSVFHEEHYWSDSSIVLNQLRKPSRSFKTFVGNRISYIQENSEASSWHYVKTDENPADLVSRGVKPSELIHSKLWWNGPDWLKSENVPIVPITGAYVPDPDEIPSISCFTATTLEPNWAEEILSRFNSLIKLKRVTVLILRNFRPDMKLQPRNSSQMTVPEFRPLC